MLTKRALLKKYGPYCLPVFQEGKFIEQLPRLKKEQPKFKLLQELPTVKEYVELMKAHYSETLESLFEGAKSDIEEIQQEMESWAENLESSSLANTSKCSEVREAADTLANINWPDSVTWPAIKIVSLPNLSKRTGRGHRASVAASVLTAVAEGITEYIAKTSPAKEVAESLKEVADTLDDNASEIENVSFPGMY
jgi:hypothetical protein